VSEMAVPTGIQSTASHGVSLGDSASARASPCLVLAGQPGRLR
jgi:hypothetical protein